MARRNPPRKSKSTWRWKALLIGLIPLLVVIWMAWGLFMPLNVPAGYRLEVRSGDSLIQIARRLGQQDMLPSPWALRLYVRLATSGRYIYPGIYPVDESLDAYGLIHLLTDEPGRFVQRFTVVEGSNYGALRTQLEQLLGEKIKISDQQMLAAIGAGESHPEGLFAPDTYGFATGMDALDLLRTLYQRQERILSQEWEQRESDLPYRTPYDALIMASIVEKETGLASEREHIAGVFVQRLKIGMRLQTDPTVIYGLGRAFDGNLRRADLERYTPYNTYRINGLPPSPIALPGRAAIHAALHPMNDGALYFVARGDGSHVFSATLHEQNEAVERYQKHRRADYHSAPGTAGSQP